MTILSGNSLKLIAALSMVLDHVGVMFFPRVTFLRILGRLAFPIFAFMIAEGCRYTRSRLRYWGMLTALAALCQIVYYLFDGSLYLSVLVTFSAAILVIYALDYWKDHPDFQGTLVFLGVLAALWLANESFTIDYGFWGCMAPAFASLPTGTRQDTRNNRIACFGLGLVLLAQSIDATQWFSLLALPLLLCYNGQRGKWKMKYFFYIFYPLHMAILQGIAMIL